MTDQTELIREQEARNSALNINLFIITEIAPCIFFFVVPGKSKNFLFYLILLLIVIVSLLVTRPKSSKYLVGISWFLSTTSAKLINYEVEPDPFVPTKLNSNIFWISLAGSTLFWIICSFVIMIKNFSILPVSILVLLTTFEIIDFILYFKAQRIAAKQQTSAVKSVLLGDHGKFKDAKENYELDSTDSDEEEEEEEIKSADSDKENPGSP